MRRIIITFFFLVHVMCLFSQTDTIFWFATPLSTRHHSVRSVDITITATDSVNLTTVELYHTNDLTTPIRTGTIDPSASQTMNFSWTETQANALADYTINAVTKQGLLLKSSNYITAYFEFSRGYNNPDIFALKGENALGRDFWVPFQTYWRNHDFSNKTPKEPAMSQICIIATEDNTKVTITTPKAGYGFIANTPRTITLNKGETFRVVPFLDSGDDDCPSRAPANRLAGTHVTSDKPIAVTTGDDSVQKGGYDYIGDQLVPMVNEKKKPLVGSEYVVMRGEVSHQSATNTEKAYVLCTKDSTIVTVTDPVSGTSSFGPFDAGYQYEINIPDDRNYIYINTNGKPASVFHVSGFGTELGGAILPTIDGCTGSLTVSFVRSSSGDLYLNMMVKSNAIDSMFLEKENGTILPIPSSYFAKIPGTDWHLLKDNNTVFNFFMNNTSVDNVTRIFNTYNVFHLGVFNETNGGCLYGYFSNYNEMESSVGIGNQGNVFFGCQVDSLQLNANGGISYHWSPENLVSNPNIANPWAFPPEGETEFTVAITQPCFDPVIQRVTVFISETPFAYFTLSDDRGCSPLKVNLRNGSKKADSYAFRFDPTGPIQSSTSLDTISFTYTNTSDTAQFHIIEFSAMKNNGCDDTYIDTVWVYPEITADLGLKDPADIAGCHPLEVEFDNTSSGDLDRWYWDFNDGSNSIDSVITHTFLNFGNADTTFRVTLTANSPFPYNCSSTDQVDITVHPYVKAGLTIDKTSGCGPLDVEFSSLSSVGASSYKWDLGTVSFNETSKLDTIITYNNATISPDTIDISFIVSNPQGCADTINNKSVVVFPSIVAAFDVSDNEICDSSEVAFTNNSTGYITNYFWDFGDANSSSTTNPTHLYRNQSTVNRKDEVSLFVSSPYCFDEITDSVLIHPKVSSDFSFDVSNTCTPLNVVLNPVNSKGDTLIWDFQGDGTFDSTFFNTNSFSRIFDNTNQSNSILNEITLISRNYGCVDTSTKTLNVFPRVEAVITEPGTTSGCSSLSIQYANASKGGTLDYFWDFNNGITSSDSVPGNHNFENLQKSDRIFSVVLKAKNPLNTCESFDTSYITVYPQVGSDFTLNYSEVCTPFEVTLTNTSSKINNEFYQWDFGDGTTSSNSDPTHIYQNNSKSTIDTRILQLRAFNLLHPECESYITDTVFVYPKVVASFNPDQLAGCHPLDVNFTDHSNGVGLNYNWDFKNGNTSEQSNPAESFENWNKTNKTHAVNMVVTDDQNCSDDTTINITVHPYVNAEFNFEKLGICTPLEVSFSPVNTSGNRYRWDYEGDGIENDMKSAPVTFTRMYTNPNANIDITYKPRLEVYYDFAPQCRDSIEHSIIIPPVVHASFSPDNPAGCHPFTANFNNQSTGGTLNYSWDYGDGNSTAMTSPSHQYNNFTSTDKTIPVNLIATAENSCYDDTTINIEVYAFIEAGFAIDKSASCSPFEVSPENTSRGGISLYSWDFGGEGFYTSTNPDHEFTNVTGVTRTPEISLIVKNNHECYDTAIRQVLVYSQVVPDYDIVTQGCHPYLAEFDNNTLFASDYKWDFGDGSTSAEKDISHLFNNFSRTEDSTFRVRLTARSIYDCESYKDTSIIVYPKPIANYNQDKALGCPPLRVGFTNLSVGDNLTNLWQIDGGIPSLLEDPSFTFNNDLNTIKEYEVRLIVNSDNKCSDTIIKEIQVYPLVGSDFETDIKEGCSPLSVMFTSNSSNEDFYYWNFDDGQSSSLENTDHRFVNTMNEDHDFVVSLTTRSDYNCESTITDTITVYPSPDVEFAVTPTHQEYIPYPEISLTNWSNHIDTWNFTWDFGDNETSTTNEKDFNKTYQIWGANSNDNEIPIQLSAINPVHPECQSSITHIIRIIPPAPEIEILGADPKGCVPLTVDFSITNQYVYSDGYNWDFDDGGTSKDDEPLYTFTEPGVYNVKLSVEGDGGLSYDYKTVEVYRLPQVDFVVEPKIVSLPYDDVIKKVQFYNQSQYGVEYLWYFGDGLTDSIKEPSHLYEKTPLEDAGEDGPPFYPDVKLVVTTEHGCVDSLIKADTLLTVVAPNQLIFPTAFNPNSTIDRNQRFKPPVTLGVRSISMVIYSRWGDVVFEAENMEDVKSGWDGTHQRTGEKCDPGVYIWKVKGVFTDGESFVKAGDVTLLD